MAVRLVAGLFGALFTYAAFLQLNDADPWLWVVVYLVAAMVLVTVAVGQHLPVWVPATMLAVSGAWSLWLATVVFGPGEVQQMFPGEEMTGYVVVDTEEGREMAGLAIVALAMLTVTVREARTQRIAGGGDEDPV